MPRHRSRLAADARASESIAAAPAIAPRVADLRPSADAELVALNAKLTLAARQWRTTADAIDDALVLIDASHNVLRLNKAAAASLGGTSWSVWVGKPSARLAVYPPWADALQLGRTAVARKRVVSERAHDAATGRTWQLWARPLPDPEHSAVLLVARDVTAFLQLQESVRRAETMAVLGELTAGVAHEVRNPLFAISSLVEAWAQRPRQDPTPYVDALRREVTRLQTLMVELLEFGKPLRDTFEPRQLSTAVQGAVRVCQPQADARNVRLVMRTLADGEVAMTPRRLERVFVNLIQNAIQHAPAGSEVSAEIDRAAGTRERALQVVVRDEGEGIAPADLPRLFTPFFSRRAGGFGLGLAISQRIVDEHHGRIVAANRPTGGAEMTVVVPIPDTSRDAASVDPREATW
ncbi:MAG TPA: ATP-binding protein [Vicinamibacterales bacterium]|nr:ATP-binding protein [Vicinamibacterales bacterium]